MTKRRRMMVLLGIGVLGVMVAAAYPHLFRLNSVPKTKPGEPDPATDGFTRTVPATASPTRLVFPYSEEEAFGGESCGISAFGAHAGGHPEGLDHVWIDVRKGTPIRSWGDCTITRIYRARDEWMIDVDFGNGLKGWHMGVERPLVKQGQRVKVRETIAVGREALPGAASAEFTLWDTRRNDLVLHGRRGDYRNGSLVSPWDYLVPAEQRRVVTLYKKYLLEPYVATKAFNGHFTPWDPLLTNDLFLHERHPHKVTGEWFLDSSWNPGYPKDVLTIIEARNPYFAGNVILGLDDDGVSDEFHSDDLFGECEIDYERGQITITNRHEGRQGELLYGLFAISEAGGRANLKLEYQAGRFPERFSNRAATYHARPHYARRNDLR